MNLFVPLAKAEFGITICCFGPSAYLTFESFDSCYLFFSCSNVWFITKVARTASMSGCVWNDMITRIAVGKYVKQLVFGQFYELYEHFAICSKNDSRTHIGLYWSSLTIKIPGRWIIPDAFAFPMTNLCSLFLENFGHELRLQRAFAICSKNSLYWGTSTSCNIKSPGDGSFFMQYQWRALCLFSK